MNFKKVLKVVGNKYLLTGFAFLVWNMFFDQNDWMSIIEKKKELNELKGNIAYINNEITDMRATTMAITTDRKKLEEYARENYRMKKDNEDIYVIDTTK